MLKYIELKTGYKGDGPAWIARVMASKSGRTLYFNGKALKRTGGQGVAGNRFDLETGDEYWVSGVKRNGQDRHRHGSGIVFIEAGAVGEYLRVTGVERLDETRLQVIADLEPTDVSRFESMENTTRDP